jgi:hypothetical protein
MENQLLSPTNRFGLHYFNDTVHYTNRDLVDWLPLMKALDIATVILKSDATRAIPEQFISALIGAEITPIIHISLPLPDAPSPADLKAILEAYARWGVRNVILFDKPNSANSWTSSSWAQQGVVERFLDKYIPLANAVLQTGMTPIFPALEPGGSYWDLVFLKTALQSLKRRKQQALLDHMALAAYAFTGGHPLDWGSGGPSKWTQNLPYFTPENSQDQRGFRIFEWYNPLIQSILQKSLPIVLLGAGISHDQTGGSYPDEAHQRLVSEILRELRHADAGTRNTIPEFVTSCNFYRLAAASGSPDEEFAWFYGKEQPRLAAATLMKETENKAAAKESETIEEPLADEEADPAHPIHHYLLLPSYEWGISDWHLDAIKPFVKKYQPTVGFSVDEARLASKVTIVGGEQSFPKSVSEMLTESGSSVERISGDGTTIATLLAER